MYQKVTKLAISSLINGQLKKLLSNMVSNGKQVCILKFHSNWYFFDQIIAKSRKLLNFGVRQTTPLRNEHVQIPGRL